MLTLDTFYSFQLSVTGDMRALSKARIYGVEHFNK